MSRTNENKLKMKDIATIGIFSALLFVVTMVAGALMGISMVLNQECFCFIFFDLCTVSTHSLCKQHYTPKRTVFQQ